MLQEKGKSSLVKQNHIITSEISHINLCWSSCSITVIKPEFIKLTASSQSVNLAPLNCD